MKFASSNKIKSHKKLFSIIILLSLFFLSAEFGFGAVNCALSCENECNGNQRLYSCSSTLDGSCPSCANDFFCSQHCDYPACGSCDNNGDCSAPTPTCTGTCICVPEFSDYAGAFALIGAIGIPVLIGGLRKKNKE